MKTKQIEGICINEWCKEQNRRTCYDCILERFHCKDQLPQLQKQPQNASQLNQIIKSYLNFLDEQIDCLQYCLYFEQLLLTQETNKQVACIKIQELEKIENQIRKIKEIKDEIKLEGYIQQQHNTNMGIFNYFIQYYQDMHEIQHKIDEYLQFKKEVKKSLNIIKYFQINQSDIEKFKAIKKNKYTQIMKITETIQYKNKNINESDQHFISQSINEMYELGKELQELKQYESAIQYYELQVKLNPKNSEAYSKMGYSLYQLGRFEQAIQIYDKSLQLFQQILIGYNNRLRLYKSQIAKKVKVKKAQNLITSQKSDVYHNIGQCLYNLLIFQEAVKMYDKAIQLNPQNSNAYHNKGISLYNLQRFQEAIETYDMAIKLNPYDSDAYTNKGISLQNLQRYQESEIFFKKAMEIQKNEQ